jgi:phage terminase large subunit-like protein
MEWSTACPDWEERIVDGRPLVRFPPLFPSSAADSLAVFKELRIVDAPGSPKMGDACRPWIFEFVAAVFGAYDGETGRRLITQFLLSVAKKNFKSGLAAGIMMTALIRNWRKSAEYLILAPTIEVANNSFRPARDMVRADEELSDLLHIQENIRQITHRVSGATLKIVAADHEVVSGKKATGVLVDELWLFGRQPRAENMLREACGGLASRPEGFAIFLTTQSDEPPSGVFAQQLQYARGVRDGRIDDPQFLPVLYEFPPDMVKRGQHKEPKNFYVTNPNLGASVDEGFLVHGMKMAVEAGEESLRGFMAKHLNLEIGLALMSNRWAGADYWEAAAVHGGLDFDQLLERSEVVDIGIDGGGLDDLLGFAAIGRDRVTHEWLLWTHAWAHPSVLERHKGEISRLEDFRNDGDLTFVDNFGDDVDQVAELVAMAHERGLLDKVGVDPHGLGGILDAIVEAKVPADKVIGISQGWKLCGSIKTAERKLAEGVLKHGGSRLMNWCVSNARIIPQGNAVGITKQVSGSAKIDPLMAMFDAVALMALNPASCERKFQMMFFGGEARA